MISYHTSFRLTPHQEDIIVILKENIYDEYHHEIEDIKRIITKVGRKGKVRTLFHAPAPLRTVPLDWVDL